MYRRILAVSLLLVFAACEANETVDPMGPAAGETVRVGTASTASVPGIEGVTFLTPLGSEGEVDTPLDEAYLSHLEVQVCRLEEDDCTAQTDAFDADGRGPARLRLADDGSGFIVNWSTGRIETTERYRISVLGGTVVLASTEVTVGTGEGALQPGRTLPIRFHVEPGACFYLVTVRVDDGLSGFPEQGVERVRCGEPLPYSYSPIDAEAEVEVRWRGEAVEASGSVPVDGSARLVATAIGPRELPAGGQELARVLSRFLGGGADPQVETEVSDELARLIESNGVDGAVRIYYETLAFLAEQAAPGAFDVESGAAAMSLVGQELAPTAEAADGATPTVVYVNGVQTTRPGALLTRDLLTYWLTNPASPYRIEGLTAPQIKYFYNPTDNSETVERLCGESAEIESLEALLLLEALEVIGDSPVDLADEWERIAYQVCDALFIPLVDDLSESIEQVLENGTQALTGLDLEIRADASRLASAVREQLQQGPVLLVTHSQGNLLTQEALFRGETRLTPAELEQVGITSIAAPLRYSPALYPALRGIPGFTPGDDEHTVGTGLLNTFTLNDLIRYVPGTDANRVPPLITQRLLGLRASLATYDQYRADALAQWEANCGTLIDLAASFLFSNGLDCFDDFPELPPLIPESEYFSPIRAYALHGMHTSYLAENSPESVEAISNSIRRQLDALGGEPGPEDITEVLPVGSALPGDDFDRSGGLFRLAVTPVDATGQPVLTGLTADDFTFRNIAAEALDASTVVGGTASVDRVIEQPVSNDPINVVLTFDASGSMNTNDPQRQALAAGQELISRLRPDDQVAVMSFTSSPQLRQALTTDKQAASNAVASIGYGGQTNMYRAVVEAAGLVTGRSNPTLVVLSDGASSTPPTESDAVAAAAAAGAKIYGIGLGTGSAVDNVRSLANRTGGIYGNAARDEELARVFEGISIGVTQGAIVVTGIGVFSDPLFPPGTYRISGELVTDPPGAAFSFVTPWSFEFEVR